MLVPLYGFLRGDTIGLLVLVQDEQTLAVRSPVERRPQAGALKKQLGSGALARDVEGPEVEITRVALSGAERDARSIVRPHRRLVPRLAVGDQLLGATRVLYSPTPDDGLPPPDDGAR